MSVDPSSLIFVVIIGIWAVYLLQHWVRRREQLATSRSVDRFSEAMRILERRAPIPVALPTHQNRSYVVASTVSSRSARITQTAQTSVAGRPEVAMKQAPNRPSTSPSTGAAAGSPGRPARPTGAGRPARPTGAGRSARTAVPRRTHRFRALVLLTLLVATPAMWAAHVWGTLYTWPALLVSALFGLDLLAVRRSVRRAASRRRTVARTAPAGARPVRQRPAAQPARARGDAAHTARSEREGRIEKQAKPFPAPVRARARSASASGSAAPATSAARSGTATTQGGAPAEVVPVHSQDAVTEVIVLEGEWAPVAVPRPTYTMKAKAERRADDAAGPLEADSESAPAREPLQPAVMVDELDLDSVLDRRRAAGE